MIVNPIPIVISCRVCRMSFSSYDWAEVELAFNLHYDEHVAKGEGG
jgi:hypothetical protein